MYQNFLKMYLGFQCSFRGGKQPLITSQGSPDDQMDHENGYKGPIARGLNVSNFPKYVPRIPKFVLGCGTTSNHFPKVPNGTNGLWEWN